MMYRGLHVMRLKTLWLFTKVVFVDEVGDESSGWFCSFSRRATHL